MAVVLSERRSGGAMRRTREILGVGNATSFGGMSRGIKSMGSGCRAIDSGDGAWSCCWLSLGKAVLGRGASRDLGSLCGFCRVYVSATVASCRSSRKLS